MSFLQQIQSAAQKGCALCSSILQALESFPREIVEILVMHRLHFHMEPSLALKSFRQLKSEFVDWNEVRISPIREIQEQVSQGNNSLELSVAIKELLEFVHTRHHHVSLEHLADLNISDIRRYLKQIRGLEPSSIELVLMLRREHAVVPLTPEMEAELIRLGLSSASETRDRRAKRVHEMLGSEAALAFHLLLLEHCRRKSAGDPAGGESLQTILQHFVRQQKRAKRQSPRKKRTPSAIGAGGTRSPARRTGRKTTKKHR